MKNLIIISTICFVLVNFGFTQNSNDFIGETVQFKATDGLAVTADLYTIDKKNAPFVILFHQARYSRGEYRPIAQKLNVLGFNCMAIDQRSGNWVNGVENETNKEAKKLNLGTDYADAFPDVEGALLYVKKELQAHKIIVWGSSYSASLMFYLGSQYPLDIEGILAFSPGEYFQIKEKSIASFAKNVKCPVFITSSKAEQKKWKGIYEALSSEKQFFIPVNSGFHGSKALWPENDGNDPYWEAVEAFLAKLK